MLKRDEDFDGSYESLVSLGMQIGDAKPRATPSEVLAKMQKGLYRDFAGEGTDTRCPICLDDVRQSFLFIWIMNSSNIDNV